MKFSFLKRNTRPFAYLEGKAKLIRNEFDSIYYLANNPDLKDWRHDLIFHYLKHGHIEGRRPTAHFDPGYHVRKYRDELKGEEPFTHYVASGKKQGFSGTLPEDEYVDQLCDSTGVVPARRPADNNDYAIQIPINYRRDTLPFDHVAAIVHVFYLELLEDILLKLQCSRSRIDVFISTDNEDKAAFIRDKAKRYSGGDVDVRVAPNRGRDIAPFLAAFGDVFLHYDAIVHLHTKKSLHAGSRLENWRDYLYDNLVGSAEIIESNLTLLASAKVGVVFPQHFFPIRPLLNWGYDFEKAALLLRRVGLKIDRKMILEFPSGSMFWARSAALKKLLDLDIKIEEFDAETGQIDGTLAHAIERSILFFAEATGYTWTKVIRADSQYPIDSCVIPVDSSESLRRALDRVYRPVSTLAASGRSPLRRSIRDTREVLVKPSDSSRMRIILLVPSINPREVFGGIATAISLFRDIMVYLKTQVDYAIIVTDAEISADALENFPGFEAEPIGSGDTDKSRVIIAAHQRENDYFSVRKTDIFIATAWWTAELARNMGHFQRQFFGQNHRFVYLIQDFEPDFYGWSSSYVLAENTYRVPIDYVAVINSEELYRFFIQSDYGLKNALCLPYAINKNIDRMLCPTFREKIILIYGRPSARRNAFEILCEGLLLWQLRNPVVADTWRIVSAGEKFSDDLFNPVQNFTNLGKLTLEQYVYWLNRSSIGISLMISPHPSYPPLEMAEAGLMTITNAYQKKDLTKRFDLISLEKLSPDDLSDAIETCVKRYETGEYSTRTGRSNPRVHNSDVEIFSPELLIAQIGLPSSPITDT